MVSARTFLILAICFIFNLSCKFKTNNTVRQDTITRPGPQEAEDIARLQLVWQEFQYSENEATKESEKTEQALIAYIVQFPKFSDIVIQHSLQNLIKNTKANPKFYKFIKEKFEHYLYDPNSPIRSDLYFEQVLIAYQQSQIASPAEQQRDQALLDLVRLNQVGAKASDFSFINYSEKEFTMHDLHSKYKLLIFYDPQCSHCKETLSDMQESTLLQQAITAEKITVLAIDPTGNKEQWKKQQAIFPKSWKIGFDHKQNIQNKPLYNIQAYPTIFLVDSTNTVLLKDVPFLEVESFLLLND